MGYEPADPGYYTADQQARIQQDLEAARHEIQRLEQELRGTREIQAIAEQRIENFRQENERLHQELTGVVINGSGGRSAINTVGASAIIGLDLPAEVEQQLADLAGKYQGVEYEKLQRVCRFESELMFLDGGDQLRPEARAALKELAKILNQSKVASFNLQIVGHCGSASVSPELAAQHPTAWHLASHQAIAVEQFLEEQSVAGTRMGTVSYADQQPLVTGNDEASRKRNSRIEIFILPPDPPAE